MSFPIPSCAFKELTKNNESRLKFKYARAKRRERHKEGWRGKKAKEDHLPVSTCGGVKPFSSEPLCKQSRTSDHINPKTSNKLLSKTTRTEVA